MDFLSGMTLLIWSIALLLLIISYKCYPKDQRQERFWYMMVLGTFVIHVIIFYIAKFIVPPQAGVTNYGMWSVILRIHGGFAIIFKELVAIGRIRKYDSK